MRRRGFFTAMAAALASPLVLTKRVARPRSWLDLMSFHEATGRVHRIPPGVYLATVKDIHTRNGRVIFDFDYTDVEMKVMAAGLVKRPRRDLSVANNFHRAYGGKEI